MPEGLPPFATTESTPAFRIDSAFHQLLYQPLKRQPPPSRGQVLPTPVFPQHPNLLEQDDSSFAPVRSAADPYGGRRWSARLIYRAFRGWLFPYLKSRVLPGEFHPIVGYLFTEWKCNLDCHYCWAFDNRVEGMTEDIARRSIDWLRSAGCRVLVLMGGEPLLRPTFAHKVVYYAARKGFWVYLPTNGRLMKRDVVDRLADAGIAAVNLAVDAVNEKPGLPKALTSIRTKFEYLVRKQYKYGYIVFLNINICRNNLEDVKQLTEIAHDYGLITDYHINESPMIEESHFRHSETNPTFVRSADWPEVDRTLDWLIDKNRCGYKMVDSVRRLTEMKSFMRGRLQRWGCRAGHNNVIIRVDGTLAPCFPLYSATHDWGTIETQKFERRQLNAMKQSCEPHCFSSLNHNLAFSYNHGRPILWVLRQALRGFQGISGTYGQP